MPSRNSSNASSRATFQISPQIIINNPGSITLDLTINNNPAQSFGDLRLEQGPVVLVDLEAESAAPLDQVGGFLGEDARLDKADYCWLDEDEDSSDEDGHYFHKDDNPGLPDMSREYVEGLVGLPFRRSPTAQIPSYFRLTSDDLLRDPDNVKPFLERLLSQRSGNRQLFWSDKEDEKTNEVLHTPTCNPRIVSVSESGSEDENETSSMASRDSWICVSTSSLKGRSTNWMY
ncbi:uncharacterized protein PAC_06030 [Phialocephala subalpina]|uniref:Uncharacterized protein n=1 Tax=Phialocephala subalpina TaxID=576137 RepID=A0A1L7WTQ1_9HELO|nr:uncharacterized protein PAC_06030 [Phialocephala subalpina]